MKDRIPKQNGKNNIIKTAVIPENTSLAELIQMLNSGLYADVMPNNATSGGNVGVDEIGTPLNKANLLSDATSVSLKEHGYTLNSDLSQITIDQVLSQIASNYANNLTLYKLIVKNNKGAIVKGVTLTLTSPYAPTTTTYVSNDKGCLWLLLPNTGTYTISRPALFAYINTVLSLTFSGDGSSLMKEIDLSSIFQFIESGIATYTTSQSGILIPLELTTIDICAIGGGGAGGAGVGGGGVYGGGGGGAGGKMVKALNVQNTGLMNIVIGSGGIGANGGNTTVTMNEVQVANAIGGEKGGNGSNSSGGSGGAGGSGGGAGAASGAAGNNGGSNGSNGSGATGGAGDGIDKHSFDNLLYCGGGGGGGSFSVTGGGAGGAGGGGAGGAGGKGGSSPVSAANGSPGTLYGAGGGGGGGFGNTSGGNGYAGAVQIRWGV